MQIIKMDALQRHTRGVLCDLKTADSYLAKYLGPMHPIRAELKRVIDAHDDQKVQGDA